MLQSPSVPVPSPPHRQFGPAATCATPDGVAAPAPEVPAPFGAFTGWRREGLLIFLVLSVATGLFFYEVILLGRTLLPLHTAGVMGLDPPYNFPGSIRPDPYRLDPGASAWVIETGTRKAAREYAAGRVPLWNEHQGFGVPLLANGQSGSLDLLRLPVLVSGSPLAWDFYYLFRIVLGGLATYLFARTVLLDMASSLVVALAFAFTGHFVIFSNNTHFEAYLLVPLMLTGVELTVRGCLRGGFVVTTVAIAAIILVGVPEATLVILLVGAAYGAYRLGWVWLDHRSFPTFRMRTAILGAAGVAGVALSGPYLAPVIEYIVNAYHVHTPERAWGLHHLPANYVVLLVAPFLNGPPLAPLATTTRAVALFGYVGSAVVVLALWGMFPSRSRPWVVVAPFFLVVAVILVAKTYGLPGLNAALGSLPGLDITDIPRYVAPLVAFCLAMLAGFGVQRLRDSTLPPRWAMGSVLLVGFVVIQGLELNWALVAQGSQDHFRRTVGVALAAAVAAWGIAAARPRLAPLLASGLCCALVFAELAFYAPRGVYQDRYDPLTEPPYVSFLRERSVEDAPFRIFALDALLFPNRATDFELDDIRALDALQIERYIIYARNFLASGVYDRFTGGPYTSPEGPTRLVGNPWFDLTGARFIVRKPRPDRALSDDVWIDKVLAANPGVVRPPFVTKAYFVIDGIGRPVLFEHPPASLRYPVTVAEGQPVLAFSPAMNPAIWDPSRGDGVRFAISVEVDGSVEPVYRRDVDPKRDPADRRWSDERVDLSKFMGRSVSLILETDPLRDPSFDWAGWANLRFEAADGRPQFELVYDAEAQVFENRAAFPRAFLVGAVEAVPDVHSAVERMSRGDLNPARVAVVESVSTTEVEGLGFGGGQVVVRNRGPLSVSLDVEAQSRSLLVVTDSYYPGWHAWVNGIETPIYPTNVAFRGVFVPAGRHLVEFSYRPISFALGVAAAVPVLVALVLTATGWPRLRIRHRAQADRHSVHEPMTGEDRLTDVRI